VCLFDTAAAVFGGGAGKFHTLSVLFMPCASFKNPQGNTMWKPQPHKFFTSVGPVCVVSSSRFILLLLVWCSLNSELSKCGHFVSIGLFKKRFHSTKMC
jgi:hypothetical protein